MSVYNKTGALPLTQTEVHLYGSSRLAIHNLNTDVQNCAANSPTVFNFTRGHKFFELTNHLGNVLVTVSDKKIAVDVSPANGTTDYYTADVITVSDYYPFGMAIPSRKYTQVNSGYRYGFNGKENEKDITVDNYDFGARVYDGRIGRWLSVDPMQKKYPGESPYLFTGANPICFNDPDGQDRILRIRYIGQDGTVVVKIVIQKGLFKAVWNYSMSGLGGYATKNDYLVDVTHDFRSGKEIVTSSTTILFGKNNFVKGAGNHNTEIKFWEYIKIKANGKSGKDFSISKPQLMVFGSSREDPGWGEADPSRPVYTINLSEANSLIELISLGHS